MKLITLVMSLFVFASQSQASVIVYSDRPAEKMKVMTDAFTKKTGIAVQALKLSAPDIKKRLQIEGVNTPADVVIVKDMIYMGDLDRSQLLGPLASQFVIDNVHSSMRSNNWTALTYRARTLVYDKSFDVSAINSYEDLADPKYAGTLCLRTSKSSYNEGLVVSMIQSYGATKTTEILEGWLNNQADFENIYTSDTTIIKDIALQNTTCTLGITNSYYLGLQMKKNPNIPVGIKFLSLKDGGVSTNGISAAITASSDNSDQARQLIEFLLSDEMQRYFSNANQDFPANMSVAFPQTINAWQGFQLNADKWDSLYQHLSKARDIFAELDYQ